MRFKFLIVLFVVLIIDYVFMLLVGDWRMAILAGLIGGGFYKERLRSFLAGFIGVLLAWVISFIPVLSSSPNLRLLDIFASIVGIPSYVLLILSIIVPSLSAGLASLLITTIRKSFTKSP